MKLEKKVMTIIIPCVVLIAVFSGFIIYKTFRPTKGLPYERISMEQAMEYMEYEDGFEILDVRSVEEYNQGHLPGAMHMPMEYLNSTVKDTLPDPDQLIYVYGGKGESRKAARMLCDLEYSNITECGNYSDYIAWKKESENS